MPVEMLPEPSTINSDDEIEPEVEEDVEEVDVKKVPEPKTKKQKKALEKAQPKFAIDFDTGDFPAPSKPLKKKAQEKVEEESEDEDEGKVDKVRAIARVEQRIVLEQKKKQKKQKDKGSAAQEEEEEEEEMQRGNDDEEEANGMNAEQEKEYFDVVIDATRKQQSKKNKSSSSSGQANGEEETIMFSQLNLSRPFLRAIESMGYVEPTPIQAQVIPYALAGRDICASAVTGSGKTAAFALPFLERLLYRAKDMPAIRVLVITPTRELAMQIHEVVVKLTQFTDITSFMVCGGKKDVKSQESTLRAQPDIVICTPGRMLDHLRNSRSVTLDDLDVLVLDEVDRLLELGFQEEVEELVKYCPIARQTMLFSATMTPSVEDLIKLSLKKPVRVKTESSNSTVVARLVQEFVKVRDAKENEAILLSLISRGFSEKTIVFFELKRDAHRFSAILKLSGIKCTELHGDLPQTQRYLSLENFRKGEADVLVATDVAARGLDISGVQTVLNAEMPRNVSTYIHRVGRTARAGCGGRAITLVVDDRRKIMKDVLKAEAQKVAGQERENQILSRTIPAAVLATYKAKIAGFEEQIAGFMEEEKSRMRLEALERETERAENLLTHADEIQSRPARTWFKTESEKKELRAAVGERVRAEKERAKEDAAERERNKSASEKQADMLRTDDYRLEADDKKKHRMSRLKRRRQEALEAEREEAEEREKETGQRAPSMDAAVKRVKANQRQKAEEQREKSAGEIAMKKVVIEDGLEDGPKKKRVKVVRQKFAVGGLDHDMSEWGGTGGINRVNKKQLKKEAREEFTEFDPEKKLRRGGKKGHQSFKSKGKYKRRK